MYSWNPVTLFNVGRKMETNMHGGVIFPYCPYYIIFPRLGESNPLGLTVANNKIR
jgi:hypothetical protein